MTGPRVHLTYRRAAGEVRLVAVNGRPVVEMRPEDVHALLELRVAGELDEVATVIDEGVV